MDLRTLLAAVLGVGLGLFFVAYPGVVIRVHSAGRTPTGRDGEYGDEATPARWRRLVRLVGVGLALAGLYFASTLLG
ncbi:hypothetical protein NGM10_08960 [Halorussus salilacus]|uniref:hypothetical protein n=1 Tax=Halorussus salilacus TaxID=2953750 RepID=UPI0020A12AA3|nr:hypothetical protein [Halorussus salilacus]USZ66860.1 hypothetical protein NGM10_08960 [Halorussus salilacus]